MASAAADGAFQYQTLEATTRRPGTFGSRTASRSKAGNPLGRETACQRVGGIPASRRASGLPGKREAVDLMPATFLGVSCRRTTEAWAHFTEATRQVNHNSALSDRHRPKAIAPQRAA